MLAAGDRLAAEVAVELASGGQTVAPPPAPAPQGDADAWLRELAGRASALHERLDAAQLTPAAPVDADRLLARLARWGNCVTLDGAQAGFERYLRCVGLDAPAARRAVGPAQWRAGAALPAWAATLGAAAFTPCFDALPGVCDPARPLPFEDLLLPFVHLFVRRTQAEGLVGGLLASEALHPLARGLLATLSAYARDTFYDAFCRFRLDGFAPLAPLIYSQPDALYRRFGAQMRAGGLHTLYGAHPVLARQLAAQTDRHAATVLEFLDRLAADLPAIYAMWGVKDAAPVISVQHGLSDLHRGGHQVFGVTFADGLRLVYKPKDMGIDVAYNELLAWLNAAGAPVKLRPLKVLNRQTYGWAEYVERAGCADRSAVARYYERAGALGCLVYLLQASDCHAENLLAAGEDPVLVDCETLLDPWPRAADHSDANGRQRTMLNRLMRDSILTTGLLPALGDERERIFSTPGLCRPIVAPVRKRSNRWLRVNTDRMAVDMVAIQPKLSDNLPLLAGASADVADYTDSLVTGFSAMYRFLVAQRPALLAPDGPLAVFRGQFVRFLFRSTHLYGVLSALAMRRSALCDGVDHSLFFEMLAYAFLAAEQTPASWSILAAEREALLRGDVPFFGTYTDQTALILESGERIKDYFVRPSFDAMQDKLRRLSEEDLAFQAGLIRAAIGVYADLQARAAATASAETLL